MEAGNRSEDGGDSGAASGEVSFLTGARIRDLALAGITLVALAVCALILEPFLRPLAWALALAVVVEPVQCRLHARVRHPGLVAALTVAITAALIVAPGAFVATRVLGEAAVAVDLAHRSLESGAVRERIRELPTLRPALEWVERRVDLVEGAERVAGVVTKRLSEVVAGSFRAIADLFITLFVLFYFVRDRALIVKALRKYAPLRGHETDAIFARVADTIRAILLGSVLVALVQGALGGLMFWWLGIPAPLLWGIVMALLAIVPILGTFVIWVPTAAWLALSGRWSDALLLAGWGGVVIAFIDNLLYPAFVGKRLRFHTLAVFIAILGGLAAFGAAGVILGPVALAVSSGFLHVWNERAAAS